MSPSLSLSLLKKKEKNFSRRYSRSSQRNTETKDRSEKQLEFNERRKKISKEIIYLFFFVFCFFPTIKVNLKSAKRPEEVEERGKLQKKREKGKWLLGESWVKAKDSRYSDIIPFFPAESFKS